MINLVQQLSIDDLLHSGARDKIRQAIGVINNIQQKLFNREEVDGQKKLDILKVGTVFQLFFIDVLASGKKAGELTAEDWKGIATKVYQYAVEADEQTYSELVFETYADYIDVSAETLRERISAEKLASITDIASNIRDNTKKLEEGHIKETDYVEACLWLSLEAMIKLLAAWITSHLPEEYAELLQSIAQLAFEYGRYVMFAREQAILEQYIQHQYSLDEKLEEEYNAYLEGVQSQAEAFQKLIDDAFSADLHQSLLQSAELARAAGVSENELLLAIDEIDNYYMG